MNDQPIKVGSIVWAGDPGYVGRIKQINPQQSFVETTGGDWSIMSNHSICHATKDQRKEYFKQVLKHGID